MLPFFVSCYLKCLFSPYSVMKLTEAELHASVFVLQTYYFLFFRF